MSIEELKNLCFTALKERNLESEDYIKRLNLELKDFEALNSTEYFIELYDKCKKENLILEKNENNLLVPYLLGITDEINISSPPEYEYGEFPDIDVDFLAPVRDYIRSKWIPERFGEENICSISAYQTIGIKRALQDVARAYGLDIHEATAITTSMGSKDEDQKALTWDKALELYPEFKDYCDRYPDVAKDAKLMLSRNRDKSKHAGGIIISSSPISDFVPLELSKDGSVVSAWTEGLSSQDLAPVGLVKFDLLVIVNNYQVALACKLIKERHGLSGICNLPGMKDWSDISYLNDPKALEMANKGDLRCVFQFDSDGIRKLVRETGVTSFDDLVAITALYRPACIKLKMHERYAQRKKGIEKYEIYPALKSTLSKTYGVQVYQEQVMRILHIVGGIPLKDCEAVRKAISKKKIDKFIKYKEMFIINGQKVLNTSAEEVEYLWSQIEAFAGYGFNLCLSDDTVLFDKNTSSYITIKEALNLIDNTKIVLDSYDTESRILLEDEVEDIFLVGEEELYEVELENGFVFKCTMQHKFICSDNKPHTLEEIIKNDLEILEIDNKYMYEQQPNI